MRGRRSKLSTAKARPGCAHYLPGPAALSRSIDVPGDGIVRASERCPPWALSSLDLAPPPKRGGGAFSIAPAEGKGDLFSGTARAPAYIVRTGLIPASPVSGPAKSRRAPLRGPSPPGPRPATGSRTGLRCARLNAKQPRPAEQMRSARHGPGLAGAPAGASTKTGFAVARRISGMEDKALKPSWSTLSQFPSAY